MRRLDPAVLNCLGLDVVLADQVKHQGRAVTDQPDQFFALVAAAMLPRDTRHNGIGVKARHIGNDLPIIAPGSAPADFCPFQHCHRHAGFGQMQRGR